MYVVYCSGEIGARVTEVVDRSTTARLRTTTDLAPDETTDRVLSLVEQLAEQNTADTIGKKE